MYNVYIYIYVPYIYTLNSVKYTNALTNKHLNKRLMYIKLVYIQVSSIILETLKLLDGLEGPQITICERLHQKTNVLVMQLARWVRCR